MIAGLRETQLKRSSSADEVGNVERVVVIRIRVGLGIHAKIKVP